MKVIVESPFKNPIEKERNNNLIYLNVVARKLSLSNIYNPLFFHSFYTQFLDDNNDSEREKGLTLSFEHHSDSDAKIVTIDRGISQGMVYGALDALSKGMEIQFFTLCDNSTPESKAIRDKIDKINSIQIMEDRWSAGVKFVEELKLKSTSPNELTNYRVCAENDWSEVERIMLEFFAPLIDQIRSN